MPTKAIPGQNLASVLAHWRFLITVIGGAAVLAFGVSELLPRRYTSTATVIIDPPATSDIRAAAVLNPAYLDSLRTFENFFTSNTLFQQAIQRFHLDADDSDIETLRRKVLKVKLQHETRILEVSATLSHPAAASALVHFITEQSIAASHEQAVAADLESMSNLTADLDHARGQLANARAEWVRAAADDMPESIQSAMESAISLEADVRGRENDAEADAGEWQVRARDGQVENRAWAQVQERAAAARRDDYARRRDQIAEEIARDRKLLAERSSGLTLASAELDTARKAFDTAQARVREFAAVAGMRSERMHIVDPGVVPRKPSFPNVPLNIVAAALLAACLSIGWVVTRAGETRPKPAVVRSAQRLA
jgi:uncharacterized protein involved in exopolysaccharide biosynthesis